MEKSVDILVSIWCLAYNHAPFIQKCLNGFINQTTDFQFEAIVHDDASSDGTAEIIKGYAEEFPDLIKPILEKENQYSKHNGTITRVLSASTRGKYVAFCEGDDYWTDSKKLQKQVDFLEQNPTYVMCFGDVAFFDVDNNKEKGKISLLFRRMNKSLEKYEGRDLFFRILLGKCHIPTETVMFRRDCLDMIKPNDVSFMMGDTPRWLDLSQCGKIKYLDICIGVYNIHHKSATHSRESRMRFLLSKYEMRVYYCYKYGFSIPRQIKRRYNNCLFDCIFFDQVSPQPIYPPFKLNLIDKWLSSNIENTRVSKVYRQLLYPLRHLFELFFIKCRMLSQLVSNLLS